jgi:transposase-like protein
MKMQLTKVLVVTFVAIALSGFAFAQEAGADPSAAANEPQDLQISVVEKPEVPAAPAKPEAVPTPLKPLPPFAPEKPGFANHRLTKFSPETSPEVAIAEAQLREAEARLQQAKIEAAQRSIENTYLQRIVELARMNAKEQDSRSQMGLANQQEYMEAQKQLAQAEAAVAKLEAATQVVGSKGSTPNVSREWGLLNQTRVPSPRPVLSNDDETELAQMLRSPINIEFEEATLREMSGFISEYVGLNIVIDVGLRAADEPASIKLEDVPLKDGLMALADAYGDVCFVIRDYGVFATTAERAMTINAPTIPANIPLLVSMQEASASGIGSSGFGFGWSSGQGGGAVGGFGGGGVALGGGLGGGGFGGAAGVFPGSAPGGFQPGAGGLSSTNPQDATSDSAATYQVKPGDSLDSVAKQFGVSVDQLRKWNGLDKNAVQVGQELTVKAP